jgi:hypothetical protein
MAFDDHLSNAIGDRGYAQRARLPIALGYVDLNRAGFAGGSNF